MTYNWNKVTIEQFVDLQETLTKEETNEQIINNRIAQAVILTGMTIEQVEDMKFSELEKVKPFLESDMPNKIYTKFRLNGIKYKPLLDARELNGSRYISIMNLSKKDQLKTLHQIMYNVCKPLKWGFRKKFPFVGWYEYDFKPQEVEQRIRDFKTLTMDIANPIAVFFSTASKILMQIIEDYSMNQMKKMTQQMDNLTEDLKQDMDG